MTTPDRSVHVPAEVVAIGLRTAGLTGSADDGVEGGREARCPGLSW